MLAAGGDRALTCCSTRSPGDMGASASTPSRSTSRTSAARSMRTLEPAVSDNVAALEQLRAESPGAVSIAAGIAALRDRRIGICRGPSIICGHVRGRETSRDPLRPFYRRDLTYMLRATFARFYRQAAGIKRKGLASGAFSKSCSPPNEARWCKALSGRAIGRRAASARACNGRRGLRPGHAIRSAQQRAAAGNQPAENHQTEAGIDRRRRLGDRRRHDRDPRPARALQRHRRAGEPSILRRRERLRISLRPSFPKRWTNSWQPPGRCNAHS